MLIGVSSDEDVKDHIKTFDEIRNQLEDSDVLNSGIGIKRFKRLLRSYKKPENVHKADLYLLEGIYTHDPEAKDYKLILDGG